ncbi:MAG: hypothetical protein R2724_02020 [Bryobacterales bacterium]
MRLAAARIRANVDHAAHRMRAVERRARSAYDFDAFAVDVHQVRSEGRCVALDRRGVAEAKAIDQDGRILFAHATEAQDDQAARPSMLDHA